MNNLTRFLDFFFLKQSFKQLCTIFSALRVAQIAVSGLWLYPEVEFLSLEFVGPEFWVFIENGGYVEAGCTRLWQPLFFLSFAAGKVKTAGETVQEDAC